MTNDVTKNPLYIDTAAGAKTGWMRIKAVAWTGIAAAKDINSGDEFKLTDTAGRVLINKIARASGDDLFFNFGDQGIRVNGIIVATMAGGICIIYLADDDPDATFVK